MKVRKLAVALALAGSMGSNLVYALGLGDAEIKSNLNEPLRAEIDLVSTGDLTRDEIIANLASVRDFQRIGIEPMFFLNEIQFNVVKNDRGELVLQLTTKKPVREPYLNFLVEVAWPSGRLLREYALLIDPPTFRDGPAEQPAQTATTAPVSAPQPDRAAQPVQSSRPSTRQASAPATWGPVSSSDTLWSIATAVRPADDLTPQQVMLALQDANPDAFLNNNINLVREGSILRIPSEEEIRSRTRREAVQQVTAQNRRFEQLSQPQQAAIDASDQRAGSAEASPAPAQGGDELRLLAGANAGAGDGSHGGDMGGVGSGDAESRLAMTLEELDQSRRENTELNSRVEDLQEQLANMQRLIELKSDQLAALQAQADSSNDQAAESASGVNGSNQGTTQESAENLMADPDASGGEGVADSAAPELEGAADTDATGQEGGAAGPEAEVAADASPAADQEVGVGSDTATDQQQEIAEAGSDDASSPFATTATNETVAPQAAARAPAEGEPQVSEPAPPAADFTPRGILQQVMTNPLYQIVAGAIAIALLALLWLLARRNAKREENFYAQLQREEAGAGEEVGRDDTGAFAAGLAAAGAAAAAGADDERREELSTQAEGDEDPTAEADVYIAYGRLDQAAQVLESAISREPSRSDLRLKLLEVYADSGNEDAFALQMSELEALDDEAAILQAESLRERLATEADAPSIDDLETQLRADVGRGEEEKAAVQEKAEEDDLGITWSLDEPAESAENAEGRTEEEAFSSDFDFDFDLDTETGSASETKAEEADSGIDFSLDDLDLDDDSSLDEEATPADADDLTPEAVADEEGDDGLDFSLDEDELDSVLADDRTLGDDSALTDDSANTSDSDRGMELSDEELDALDLGDEPESGTAAEPAMSAEANEEAFLDTELDASVETRGAEGNAGIKETASDLDEAGAEIGAEFDDSFLEELDAELDKVGEESAEEPAASAPDDAELDDLELDVTDEDLALIEEVAGGEEGETAEGKDPVDAEADDLLDLDLDEDSDLSAEAGEIPTVESRGETGEQNDASGEVPRLNDTEESVAADMTGEFDDSLLEESNGAMADLSESDLGDEDDFDFLEGTDEAATKLDLARAYVEMGDAEGARDILEEVSLEGSDIQKQDAQALLKKLA